MHACTLVNGSIHHLHQIESIHIELESVVLSILVLIDKSAP